MQISNNYQSPNFGMALHIESKAGLKSYVNGWPRRIEEVAELGTKLRKADKALLRRMDKTLKESGVSESELLSLFYRPNSGSLQEHYVPRVKIDDDGYISLSHNTMDRPRTFYRDISDAKKEIELMHDTSFKEFIEDIEDILTGKYKKSQEARVEEGIDNLMDIYG